MPAETPVSLRDAAGRARRGRASGIWTAVALLAIGLACAVRVILAVQPLGGDPGIYAYVGSRILAGDLPYRDIFEQKPPGVLYTYAAGFAVFGRSMLTVQVMDLLAWSAAVLLAGLVVWSLWQDRGAAWLAAVLAAVFINPNLQSSFKQVGQAETFMAVWTMAALWLAVRSGQSWRGGETRSGSSGAGFAFVAGLCCAMAMIYKYNAATYGLAAVLTVACTGKPARAPRLLMLGAGLLVPLAATAGYFLIRGSWHEFYEATVLYNIGYARGTYGSLSEFAGRAALMAYRFATMNFLWLTGGAGALVLLWRLRAGDRRGLPLLAFLAAAAASILVNAKFFPQYFLQILPFLCASAAIALTGAWRLAWHERRYLTAALLTVLFALPLLRHTPVRRVADEVGAAWAFRSGRLSREAYYARFRDPGRGFSALANHQLAERLRRETTPEQPIYIYGGEPIVLFLAERRTPSRFLWNDPFLTGAYAGRYTHADLIRELEADPPAFFVVLRNDENLVDPVDSLTHFRQSDDLREWVASRYRDLGWFEDFLIFERRS